jgi:hypothetical protein
MRHVVGKASWLHEGRLTEVRYLGPAAIEKHGPIRAWTVDDTGCPKKATHSVGVTRQGVPSTGGCWMPGSATIVWLWQHASANLLRATELTCVVHLSQHDLRGE